MTRGLTALAALSLIACGGHREAPPAGPVVSDAWARPAQQGANGAIYLTLENADTVDLHITGVSTNVARSATLHETTTQGNITGMTPRPDVAVVRGATVAMRPGGLHVMLTSLARELRAGDSVPLTLRFADGRSVRTAAVVRAE